MSKENRMNILKSLRRTDPIVTKFMPNLIQIDRGQGKSEQHHVESVSDLIKLIPKYQLKEPARVKVYSKCIKEKRKQLGHSQGDIALRFDVSRATIEKEEGGKKKKIDPFYLECYSLYYQVSPLYLIGLTEDEYCYDFTGLTNPIMPLDKKVVQTIDIIMYNLYRIPSSPPEINFEMLDVFLRICELSHTKRSIIKNMLLTSPKIRKLMATPLRKTILNIGSYSRDYEKEHHQVFTFEDLGKRDLSMLKLFACITLVGDDMKKAICVFLNDGGYLS